jgi:DHA2 family multidrug resistance protein
MARSLGSSAGISLLQAGVIRQSAQAHQVLADHTIPSDPAFRAALPALLNPDTAFGVQALNGEVTRQASMIGYDSMFSVMIVMIVVMAPLLLLLRPPRQLPTGPIEAVE